MTAADVAVTMDLRGDVETFVAAVATYSRRHGCSETTALVRLILDGEARRGAANVAGAELAVIERVARLLRGGARRAGR